MRKDEFQNTEFYHSPSHVILQMRKLRMERSHSLKLTQLLGSNVETRT